MSHPTPDAPRLQVFQFPARDDNYAVLLVDRDNGLTIAVDAPETEPMLEVLEDKRLSLTHILTTHHHHDHVAGNVALKERFGCEIVGPAREKDRIPGIDRTVDHGDAFAIGAHRIEVIGTPGHTMGQIAYHLPDHGLVFAADALFAMGCGRVFEGEAADMHEALSRLAALPPQTKVYAGHEYTLSNARFAISVDGANQALIERAREVELLRDEGKPTLPTTIALELETNPFLRTGDPAIREGLGMTDADDVAVFAELRARKDRF